VNINYLLTALFTGLGVTTFLTGEGPGVTARFTGLAGPGVTAFFTGEGPITGPETALVLIRKIIEKVSNRFLYILLTPVFSSGFLRPPTEKSDFFRRLVQNNHAIFEVGRV